MRILDNGLVEIENADSGERRQVKPEELASYSPFLANQYSEYMDTKTVEKGLSGANADPFPFLPANNNPQPFIGPMQNNTNKPSLDAFEMGDPQSTPTAEPERPAWDKSFATEKPGILSRIVGKLFGKKETGTFLDERLLNEQKIQL